MPAPVRTLALLGRLLRNRIGPLVLHVRTACRHIGGGRVVPSNALRDSHLHPGPPLR
ncbi:hypothetical protein XFF6166_20037 [Xanthomonas citri pv. fuscans]|nr:hypothetical protein XFF6166_20037 [Xanthomonas citri pv. fuscans]SON99125.1 hypothetical protein XFF6960_130027 [Xanthomonas citri pv. fuscans]SOO05574.1 hypothetical protein XFF7767_450028 [Xanthomonas citri pv. fuscans]SOO08883.1 hypothetical protein XFF6970_30037 [Xanthomonas citri pv. fuscans]SOO15250.1 hypothetical protein XFF7766_510037 [Xanthomonas citri pv. fuscans]